MSLLMNGGTHLGSQYSLGAEHRLVDPTLLQPRRPGNHFLPHDDLFLPYLVTDCPWRV